MGSLKASKAIGWWSMVRTDTARVTAARIPVARSAARSTRLGGAGIRAAGGSKRRVVVPVASAKASAVKLLYHRRVAVSS